jgi:hypothetical protein
MLRHSVYRALRGEGTSRACNASRAVQAEPLLLRGYFEPMEVPYMLRKQTMFVMLTQRVNAAEQYLYVHARVLVATVNSGNRPQDASANAFELASGTRPGLTRACAVEVDLSMNRSTTPRLSNIFYRLQQQRVVTGSKHAYIHGDVKHPPSTNQPSRWGRASTYHMY